MKIYGFAGTLLGACAFGLFTFYYDAEPEFAKTAVREPKVAGDAKKAFEYCKADTRGNTVKAKEPSIWIDYGGVPAEVCACQAPHMARILGSDRLGQHYWVIPAVGGVAPQTRPDNLPISAMDKTPEGRKRIVQLSETMQQCVRDYAREHNARADGRLTPK
jgi:hypothetical protein